MRGLSKEIEKGKLGWIGMGRKYLDSTRVGLGKHGHLGDDAWRIVAAGPDDEGLQEQERAQKAVPKPKAWPLLLTLPLWET